MEQLDIVQSDQSRLLSGMTRGVLANSCRSRQDLSSDVSAPAALHIMVPNCDMWHLFGSHPKWYFD